MEAAHGESAVCMGSIAAWRCPVLLCVNANLGSYRHGGGNYQPGVGRKHHVGGGGGACEITSEVCFLHPCVY